MGGNPNDEDKVPEELVAWGKAHGLVCQTCGYGKNLCKCPPDANDFTAQCADVLAKAKAAAAYLGCPDIDGDLRKLIDEFHAAANPEFVTRLLEGFQDIDRALGQTIDEREAMGERVNAIAAALGLSEKDSEWSNLNDVGVRCVEAADALLFENKRLRKRLFPVPCKGCPGCSDDDCPDAIDTAAYENDRLRAVVEAARPMRDALKPIGDAQAWFGTMGDDGQGHDEGSILAGEMLAKFDAALDRLDGKEERDADR